MTQSSATQRSSEHPDAQFSIDRTLPGRWTITFNNPPINIFVPSTIVELGTLLTELEADPSVKVVVFQSANPDFMSMDCSRPRAHSQGFPILRRTVYGGGADRGDADAAPG